MSLENVKPGDTLIWHGRYGRDRRIITVDRVTKTQVITDYGRYRKSDGRAVGRQSAWGSTSLTVPEPGEIEEIHERLLRKKLINQILDACQINLFREMSLGKLKQLNNLLETE